MQRCDRSFYYEESHIHLPCMQKLKKSLNNVQNLKDVNKDLSRVIRNMEIEREAMDKAQQELVRRSQTLGEIWRSSNRCPGGPQF